MAHSAKWDDSYSYEGKTVCVIGSGSSAIQIVPQIQPCKFLHCLLSQSRLHSLVLIRALIISAAKHLISFNRSPTWITPEFGEKFAKDGRDTKFPEQLQNFWAGNPEAFLKFRKDVENEMNHLFDLHYKDSDVQKEAMIKFRKSMERKVAKKPELAAKLIPDFAVGCRR